MKNMEQEVVNAAKRYRSDPEAWRWILDSRDSGSRAEKLWVDTVASHLENSLLPRFHKRDEHLIELFLAQFLWGKSSGVRQGISDDRIYNVEYGHFATGGVYVTDKNLYISAFKELTSEIPLRKKGLVRFVLLGLMGQRDQTKPYRENRTWRKSYRAIHGVQVMGRDEGRDYALVATSVARWEIHPVYGLDLLVTALEMGRTGRFEGLFEDGKGVGEAASSEKGLLEDLHDLRERGILTQEEYETKKAEILSKM
jgi:hypothetical protein